jgi:hypothetical protein
MARCTLAILLAAFAPALAPAGDEDGQAAEELFESRIRPLLIRECRHCHGPRESERGFRVDSREALLTGGESGAAIVPGDADKSLLIQAVRRTHEELQMPPERELPAAAVDDLVRWINAGAVWPATAPIADDNASGNLQHWAFQPVRSVAVPGVVTSWGANPIDEFIGARWQEAGLRPVGLADRRTLLRRLFFDLTGMPPTPEEAENFLADDSDAAFEKLVDRLLASPRYGQRWGRHWMDVVRYADTAGDNADYPVPEAGLYRDYIIESFNADKAYDQFVREQLAGDLLAAEGPRERYADQVVATGFLALSRRYATGPYEFWHLTLEDTIDTVGQAFLGLTLRCARCHDHKFDPVTTEDYYALYGIFNSTRFPWAGAEEFASKKFPRRDFVPLVPAAETAEPTLRFQQELDRIAAQLAALQQRLGACTPDERAFLEQEINRVTAERLNMQRSSLPADVPGAYAVVDGAIGDVAVQHAGDPADAGGIVPRGAIKFLSREPLAIPPGASGRRQLAEWLTQPEHPLTARVMANRIWQHHFGRGLVATPSNFGTRGAAPTHPELLDYLARRFVESGWSVKAVHRLMLTSRAWQLSSADDERNAASDTGNEFFWRHDRRRLDAESIRDALLAVSGRLDETRPGPHPFPPISAWGWTQHSPFKDVYPSEHRTVYLMTQRLQRHPFLALFDGPDANRTTDTRTSSTVPLQSLYLMNSPEMAGFAAALAERLISSAETPRERMELAWRLCYTRPPSDAERDQTERYVRAFADEFRETRANDDELPQTADGTARGPSHDAEAERAAWTSLARVLLSAGEFFYVD